jgi:chromosome segregation ATPase
MPDPVKIKVKNEDAAAAVKIVPDDQSPAVTLSPGEEKQLEAADLVSKSFAARLTEGKLSLVPDAESTPEQLQLARQFLPPIVALVAGRARSLRTQVQAQKTALAQKRDEYNALWENTEALLTQQQKAAVSLAKLSAAAASLLGEKQDPKAVAEARAEVKTVLDEIAALEKDPVDAVKLPAWFASREAKKAELEAAQQALEKALAQARTPQADVLSELKKLAEEFTAADPAQDIGAKIAT